MTPPSVNSIGFVTKSNVENVQRLGGVICLETDAPLPDAQSILRRVHSREAPHVAGSLGGKLVDRARYPVGDVAIESVKIARGFVAPADQPLHARRSFRMTSSCESVLPS